MKQLFFLLCLTATCSGLQAQTTDSASYVADSIFTVHQVPALPSYVRIEPVRFNLSDTANVSILVIQELRDSGPQYVDGTYINTGVVFFVLQSADGSTKYYRSLPAGGDTYQCARRYGWKFVYWKIADKYNLNIE